MDSITQATLGALCGEMVLGRKLGYKGALWGLLFGTLPDLDVLSFGLLTATEQLQSHRGVSHSILLMFIGAFIFGAILKKIHHTRPITYRRFFTFVFLAWSTHVFIDCFNTYGTQILEPFSSQRFPMSNIAIIDLFFLLPMLIGLALACIIYRKRRKLRTRIGWITTLWLCSYFAASLFMKMKATSHFKTMMAEKGIETSELVASPTISNIFLWRMHARDKDQYHVAYWSLFDQNDREPVISSFDHGHELEQGFEDSKDLEILKWFCMGWHKVYKEESEPNSIYIAAIQMSDVRIPLDQITEMRPIFLWKITKTKEGYDLQRPFKMSKDGSSHMKKALQFTYQRVKGQAPEWMQATWSWNL